MQKISLSRSDSLEEVKRKLVEGGAHSVILAVPPGGEIGATHKRLIALANFAAQHGIDIFIESADEGILSRAEDAGLEAIHPYFGPSSPMSDIVIPSAQEEEDDSEEEDVGQEEVQVRGRSLQQAASREEKEQEGDGDARSAAPSVAAKHAFFSTLPPKAAEQEDRVDYSQGYPDFPSRRPRRKVLAVLAGVLGPVLILAAVAWGTSFFFGRADVSIVLKRMSWQKEISITATAGTASSSSSSTIPAEIFSEKKNLTQLFPGSEEKDVSQKARGTITIYNAYSSASQPLVATTRFATPEGKIYRLLNAVTVPGAKIADGKITPSSIVADVVADAAGDAYNLTDKVRLTIPGFDKTPKFKSFYGEVIGINGGYIGRRKVPTQTDLDNAKKKTEEILRGALITAVTAGKPEGFRVLSDSADIQITKMVVNPNSNDEGNFSVFAEGAIRVFGLQDSDLKTLFLNSAEAELTQDAVPSAKLEVLNADYSNVKTDFANGILTMTAKVDASLVSDFNADDFRKAVAGLTLDQMRSALAATPGVKEGTASLWPRWMGSAPKDPARIKVEVK
jgi:hypothetical protein